MSCGDAGCAAEWRCYRPSYLQTLPTPHDESSSSRISLSPTTPSRRHRWECSDPWRVARCLYLHLVLAATALCESPCGRRVISRSRPVGVVWQKNSEDGLAVWAALGAGAASLGVFSVGLCETSLEGREWEGWVRERANEREIEIQRVREGRHGG